MLISLEKRLYSCEIVQLLRKGQLVTSPKRKNSEPENPLSFEESLQELEGIVRSLEAGNLELDETLSAYETGVKRLRQCHKYLADAERKILLLKGVDENGRPTTEPFSDEELSLEEKQTSRSKRRSAGSDLD